MDATETKQVTFSRGSLVTFLSLFSGHTYEITDVRRTASALDELEAALKEFGLSVTEKEIVDDGDARRVFELSSVSTPETTSSQDATAEVPAAPQEPVAPVEGNPNPQVEPNQTPINQ